MAFAGHCLLLSLGLAPALASQSGGGNEPSLGQEVCVIAPRVESDAAGKATAEVPLSRPTIFAVGAFDELQIERSGQLAWSLLAGEAGPIHGPVPWPIAPILPDERLVLRLRPRGGSADDFASIGLRGAPARVMARADALLLGLGADPNAWLRLVRDQLAQGDLPLALGLLFAFEGPSSPQLDALRMEVYDRGCGGGSLGAEATDGLSRPYQALLLNSSQFAAGGLGESVGDP